MDYILQNGELCHARSHKYIKREWHNGRWRYWYKPTDNGIGPNATANTYNRTAELYKILLDDRAGSISSKRSFEKFGKLSEKEKQSLAHDIELHAALGRDYAAYMQALGRWEKAERQNKKLINRARNFVSKFLKKKTKSNKPSLSKILKTEKTTTHHMFGSNTSFRR